VTPIAPTSPNAPVRLGMLWQSGDWVRIENPVEMKESSLALSSPSLHWAATPGVALTAAQQPSSAAPHSGNALKRLRRRCMQLSPD
jgi:hypothetical protein